MTRRLAAAVLLLVAVVAIAGAQTPVSKAPAADGPTLPEVETLRAENLKLKAQVLELQRALAQAQLDAGTAALNSERTALEGAFRVTLGAKDGEVFELADPPV